MAGILSGLSPVFITLTSNISDDTIVLNTLLLFTVHLFVVKRDWCCTSALHDRCQFCGQQVMGWGWEGAAWETCISDQCIL